MIDRVLAEITSQAEILFCDCVSRVSGRVDIVPVSRAIRMTDTIEGFDRVALVEMERGRAVLDRARDRLKEGIHIVICERTGVDGRAFRCGDRDRDKFIAGQGKRLVLRFGCRNGSRVVVRMQVLVRHSRHADRIARNKQAAYVGFSPVYSRAELRRALCAGGVGHVQREGIVRVLDPAAGVDGDLKDPLELERVVLAADVDRHAARTPAGSRASTITSTSSRPRIRFFIHLFSRIKISIASSHYI